MKNQYFGDINDYLKYGLLRTLISSTGLRTLVAWMLTPDDRRSDGRFTAYLDAPSDWRRYDPPLFDALSTFLDGGAARSVACFESSDVLPDATYYSQVVPRAQAHRQRWFHGLLDRCPAP